MNQNDIDKYLDNEISKAEKKIDKLFVKRLKDINKQIAVMYQKYASGGELTYTDLNKYNRLRKELDFIAEKIDKDFRFILKEIDLLLEKQYVENYLRSAYVYEFEAQVKMGFTIPTAAVIAAAIENPIPELRLPVLMETARNQVISRITIEITQGLLAGEDYAKMASRIAKALDFGRAKARRIARTEAHRVQVSGRLDSAEKAAKKADLKKMWDSTLDTRTRIAHRKLDGKVVPFNGVFKSIYGGVGVAPGFMHNPKDDINCRCSIIFLVNGQKPERRISRINGKNVVIPYMTYEEWKKQLEKAG
ncbi:NAD(+)--arginine ADP-ribosyltransferase EFV [Bacillus licheniformis]|uniref:phage head morphogenesis protein n=1 Tax=Bacillus licheniformis TaxID=1402 RepID=UPI00047261D4|nr:phage minor head protein [Bacillus licheniformis]TWJ84350.1 NAD(+)--arginine ADP-ribosyltransferase EFV [Bacillus licheniformis]